jgi:hypothetical protein
MTVLEKIKLWILLIVPPLMLASIPIYLTGFPIDQIILAFEFYLILFGGISAFIIINE